MASDAGGGGGSSFFAADPAEVRSAGRTLWSEAGAVAASRRYGPLEGLVEAAVVEQAAASFRDAWDGPLDRWQTSLAALGDAADSSATAIAENDAQASTAWGSMLGAMG